MSTWTINPSEYEAYRERHGSASLLPHVGRGRAFVCKHHDAEGAVLVEIGTHAELVVTADEFKAEFFLSFLDEATLYFGSPEVQASAQIQLNAQMAAEQVCIEHDRSARILAN